MSQSILSVFATNLCFALLLQEPWTSEPRVWVRWILSSLSSTPPQKGYSMLATVELDPTGAH